MEIQLELPTLETTKSSIMRNLATVCNLECSEIELQSLDPHDIIGLPSVQGIFDSDMSFICTDEEMNEAIHGQKAWYNLVLGDDEEE